MTIATEKHTRWLKLARYTGTFDKNKKGSNAVYRADGKLYINNELPLKVLLLRALIINFI